MKIINLRIAAALLGIAAVFSGQTAAQVTAVSRPLELDPATALSRIALPPGFRISIYRDGVAGARSMALGSDGVLYVGTRKHHRLNRIGKVYAVTNPDGDDRGDQVITVAEGLNVPNGVAWRAGDLYVAEIDRILRFPGLDRRLQRPPEPEVIVDGMPDEYLHGWKYLRFGPDDRLYVPVGAPCNICEPVPPQGTIFSVRPDGSDRREHARGIRNSVGFDFHPDSGALWFTDNGRDLWGDDRPPEELNVAPAPGLHFGYPYRYGKTLVDDSFSTDLDSGEFAAPALEFPAHNALLGMRFYRGEQFPAEYRGDIFIASHGSWNRSEPDGFKLFRVRMEGDRAVAWEEFASGWMTADGEHWGRPVDVEVAPDGALLVSDDFADVIYRISYEG